MTIFPQEIKSYLRSICQYYSSNITHIWLIGSRAEGAPRSDSDWNFLIKGDLVLLKDLENKKDVFFRKDITILIIYDGNTVKNPFNPDQKLSLRDDLKWEEYNGDFFYTPALKEGQINAAKHSTIEISIDDIL
ncbi:MAG: nucleotidyltransferase domain-containing protein [Chitinivibrionales bacterium]|nr:nucleotidyltransferase domain-containing protein [Chitinivibrionales bacterium]